MFPCLTPLRPILVLAMISQLNNLLYPSFPQKPLSIQNPSSLSLKLQTFRGGSKHIHVPHAFPATSIRVSRALKTQAQHVFFDYLHSTRGYNFLDAEFISRNSPRFVESLASKINADDDDDDDAAGRSLKKFLRYNPVNEFEPFLESLGIGQSELHLILPPGMIFLTDDHVLLDNFHALCNYGVPRNRMGKIYREAREIFRYGSGLLSSKLQGLENLGLSKSTIMKMVVCCPLLLVGDDMDCEFVLVIDWLKKIGIQSDWIVNYMSCSRTYSWKKMLAAIEFLHKVGYDETGMKDLFKANPKFLLEGLGKNLYIFLAQSRKLGVKTSVIYSYFREYPHIMSNKSAKNLWRVIGFLDIIGMGRDDIAHILSNYMHLLSKHSLKGHKTVCKDLKVGKAELCQIIKDDPLKLVSLASKMEQKSDEQGRSHDPCKYLDKTTFLMKLGYTENSEEMEKALKMFRGRGDQLQERFDCLVEAGLDYNSVIQMIRRIPMILNLKRISIQKKIDFLKSSGYPVECLVGFPTYFCHDLEKIIERLSMYAWLKERNAVNPALTLSTIVSSNEKRFVKYFVNIHPQGPTMWKSLKELSNKDKN